MEREDIIINGVSINDLKAKRDAIREGAAKLISENIELAKSLTRKIVEAEDKEEVTNLAKEAYEALDTANLISGVSNVSFYLPYYEEYGDENDNICSSLLENSDNQLVNESKEVNQLCRLFYSMESQSRDWHASTC